MMQILRIHLSRQTQITLSRYKAGTYFVNYQLLLTVVTCNLYISNFKIGCFVAYSFKNYSALDNRCEPS